MVGGCTVGRRGLGEETLRWCWLQPSMAEGRDKGDRWGPRGIELSIRKYTNLQVGLETLGTYKMAYFKHMKNCNGMIPNT